MVYNEWQLLREMNERVRTLAEEAERERQRRLLRVGARKRLARALVRLADRLEPSLGRRSELLE